MAHAPHLPAVARTAEPHHPALSLLTDLQQSPCVVASHSDGIEATLHLMKRAGVRMVFVSGADGGLVGMVSAEDIQGERPVVRASSHHVPVSELTLSDVMVPVGAWDVVDLSQVRTARLGDIADVLAAQRRLYQSQLFRQALIVVPDSADSAKQVVVNVREAPFTAVQAGGGFNTVEFLQLQGNLTLYNFQGSARRVDLRSAVGNLFAGPLYGRSFVFGTLPPGASRPVPALGPPWPPGKNRFR